MERVAYTVTATLPDGPSVDRYIAWLKGGHVQQVVAGGAESAQIIRLDEPPLTVQTRYEFPSRGTFDSYIRDRAPRLRAEGLSLFGPQTGVAFRRDVGTIVYNDP